MAIYCSFTSLKKYIMILIVISSTVSLYAKNDLKLLKHWDNSLNQATGSSYWANNITGASANLGSVANIGSICGLTQDSEFQVELIVAGSAGAHVGVTFIPYDKNGTALTTIDGFLWNEELSIDYSTITASFTIPAQSSYTIEDIASLEAHVYNMDSSSGEEIWVKSLSLHIDESTLLKNLSLYEYQSTDSDVVIKDGEYCKELSSYYKFLQTVYVNKADIDDSTVFEFQVKAYGTSDARIGVRATAYDENNVSLGAFSIFWNKTLNSNVLRYHKARFTLGSTFKTAKTLKIYIYRTNQLGTIWYNASSLDFDYSTVDTTLFSADYESGDTLVELYEGLWSRKLDNYYYYLCPLVIFPDRKDDFETSNYQTSYKISINAAGEDGAMLGAKVEFYNSSNVLLESLYTGLWNETLTTDYTLHSSIFQIPADASYSKDDIAKVRIIVYRSNQIGTLWTNSVDLECFNAVSIRYNELEVNLVADGFTLTEEGDMLLATKSDQRKYYAILDDANGIAKYAYLGITYLKSSAVMNSFPVGVYIYETQAGIAQLATDWGVTSTEVYETIAKDVADHNCNTVYYSNLSPYPTDFKSAIAQFQLEGIDVFGQLNGSSYLRTENDHSYYEATTVPATTSLLPDYIDTTGIIGWSGKEECAPEDVSLVEDYRALCEQLDMSHGTLTVHNDLDSQKNDTMNLPDWFGFDRYRFRNFVSPSTYGMNLTTPLYGMNLLSDEIDNHYWASAEIGRPLIYVGQAYGEQYELTESLLQSKYSLDLDQMSTKTGFIETSTDVWTGWATYMPPANCMYLQTWTAIAGGAKGILLFHYFTHGTDTTSGKIQVKGLVDDDLIESSQWLEFKNSVSDVLYFLPLASQWHKEWNPKASVDVDSKWITANSFIRDFDEERYLVVVNKRIGTWDTTSPEIPTNSTQLYYDNDGLAGITAATALSFEIDIEGSDSVWDLYTGTQLTKNANGLYDLSLDPGRGVVLMQGTQTELTAIRTELNL